MHDNPDERTLLLPRDGGGGALPRGTRLQEFVVERTLGVGSYSVVYVARDTRLDRRVALKEYLPATLAMRAPDGSVVARLPRFQQAFDSGLKGFVNEGRLLGAFDHPSLLKVFRFWAENGTAYMGMPYYEGVTLERWLADLGAPPSERWLRDLADALMAALEVMHAQRCVHRNVAPDNVLLLFDRAQARSGASYLEQKPHPVLLDFGAARRVIGDATQALTAMLKSGYSPVEQYEGAESPRQGPWTDVYALCALLYAALAGRAPLSSIARVVRDEQVPARTAGKGRYSPGFLAAIDAGLAVRPEQRPQTMAELRAMFDSEGVDIPLGDGDAPPARRGDRLAWLALGAALIVAAGAAALWFWRL